MNKATPKISVVMSVYNGSLYLRESIESILNQTFTDFEFIIINDCSTDDSKDIIAEYTEKDSRIVLVNNPENIGLTKSLNKGLKIAKGEYIARQDADDVSLPGRFEKQVAVLNEHPEVALVSCEINYIDSQGNTIGKDREACSPELVDWYLLFYNRLAGHSQVAFRRELVINLDGYSEDYRYSQDYELWCRIVKVGKIFILPEVLLQQRRHNKCITFAKSSEQEALALTVVQTNVQQVTDKKISLEEAKYLKDFWMGNINSNFLENIQIFRKIDMILNEILRLFINKKSSDININKEYERLLHIIIGQQFILSLPSIKVRDRFITKIIVFMYALKWYPFGGFKYLLRGIKNSCIRQLPRLSFKENTYGKI